jgi:hypothetical protein
MFLVKQPSMKSRVLNYELCPPHDLVHDLESYPTFYDPLYYPHYHPYTFSTPENLCAWLQDCLHPMVMFVTLAVFFTSRPQFSMMVQRCVCMSMILP